MDRLAGLLNVAALQASAMPGETLRSAGLAGALEAVALRDWGALEAAVVAVHRAHDRLQCPPPLDAVVDVVLAVTNVPVEQWAPPRSARRVLWLLLAVVEGTAGAVPALTAGAADTEPPLAQRLQRLVVHVCLAGDGVTLLNEHLLAGALSLYSAVCAAGQVTAQLWCPADVAKLLAALRRLRHSVPLLSAVATAVCCMDKLDLPAADRTDAAVELLTAGALAVGPCPKKTGTAAARLAKAAHHMLADLPRCVGAGREEREPCRRCTGLCEAVAEFARAWPHSLPAFHHLCMFLQAWASHVGAACVPAPVQGQVNAALSLALSQVEFTQDVIAHVFAMNASWPWAMQLSSATHEALQSKWEAAVLDAEAEQAPRAQAAGLLLAVHAQQRSVLRLVPLMTSVLHGAVDGGPVGVLVTLALVVVAALASLDAAAANACVLSCLHKWARNGALQAAARSELVVAAFADAAAEAGGGEVRPKSALAALDVDDLGRLLAAMAKLAPAAAAAACLPAVQLVAHCAAMVAASLDSHHTQAWVDLLTALMHVAANWSDEQPPERSILVDMRTVVEDALQGGAATPETVLIAAINVGLAAMSSATRGARLQADFAATGICILGRVMARAPVTAVAGAATGAYVAKVLHFVEASLDGGVSVLSWQAEAFGYLVAVSQCAPAAEGRGAILAVLFDGASKVSKLVMRAPPHSAMPRFTGAFAAYEQRSKSISQLADWARAEKQRSAAPSARRRSRRRGAPTVVACK